MCCTVTAVILEGLGTLLQVDRYQTNTSKRETCVCIIPKNQEEKNIALCETSFAAENEILVLACTIVYDRS